MGGSKIHISGRAVVLSVLAIFVFISGVRCDGGGGGAGGAGGPGASCAGAPELYAYSQGIHAEMAEALRFGSTWEATVNKRQYNPAVITRIPSIFLGAPADDEVTGEREYRGRTSFTFNVPAGPEPLSCAYVTEISGWAGGDQQLARDLVLIEYLFAWMDIVGNDGIQVSGGGTHSSRVGPYFATNRATSYGGWGLLWGCWWYYPCPDIKYSKSGCEAVQETHTVNASVGLIWEPGTPAELSLGVNTYTASDPERMQTVTWDEDNYQITDPTNPNYCQQITPVCEGSQVQQEQCGLGYRSFSSVVAPLQNGTHTVSSTETETVTVTLRCTSGCECLASVDCDDGSVCTQDECNGGNCVNTPDDSIIPPQVEGDCRYCEAGEERSVREEIERECEILRLQTVSDCATSNENWLVHWVSEYAGDVTTAHYCEAGTVPGGSLLGICNGAGQCTAGQRFTFLNASASRMCLGYAGQELEFACDVFCSWCTP